MVRRSGGILVLSAILALGSLVGVPAPAAHAATLTVTTTTDTPIDNTHPCPDPGAAGYTLRCAMTRANADASGDTIAFNITTGCDPTTSVCTVTVLNTPLPPITNSSVIVDGYTQQGASPNTNVPTSGKGDTARILIQIANGAGANVKGIEIDGNADTVRGLSITGFGGDGGAGVYLAHGARNGVIAGNFIGVKPDGQTAAGNGAGILTDSSVISPTYGGPTPDATNVIGRNNGAGIEDYSSNPVIKNNLVGLTASGTGYAGNGDAGIRVHGVGASIGGIGAGNVVSGNSNGIVATDHPGDAANVTIQGNFVGTDITGTALIGNYPHGITSGDYGTSIGGTAAGAGNLVSGHGGDGGVGVYIFAPNNVVQGNKIGTDVTGTKAVPNSTGIRTDETTYRSGDSFITTGGVNLLVGGTDPGAGNIVSGNGGDGILLDSGLHSGAHDDTVVNDFIGVDVSGSRPLGNGGNGVAITRGSTGNRIVGNTIAYNGKSGIYTDTGGSVFSRNSIYDNGGLGIDFTPQGTVNCTGTGADCPVITSATTAAIKGTACPGCTVEVFLTTAEADDQGHGEGATHLGTATADASGNWTLSAPYTRTVYDGHYVTATATTPGSPGPRSQTSEFSANVRIGAQNTGLVVTSTGDTSNCPNGSGRPGFTLRCAINQANADGSGDTIGFNMLEDNIGGYWTIQPPRVLPTLTADHTTIDGYTQLGAHPNTNPLPNTANPCTTNCGDNAVLKIRLDNAQNWGAVPAAQFTALTISGSYDTVQGLAFTRFASFINLIDPGTHRTVGGNWIGLAPDGSASQNWPCGAYCLQTEIEASTANGTTVRNDTVGGGTPAAANVITGRGSADWIAIHVSSGGNTIQGNYIGTNPAGSALLNPPNKWRIALDAGSGNQILNNVIGADGGMSIETASCGSRTDPEIGYPPVGSQQSTIQGNLIGTNAGGTAALSGTDGLAICLKTSNNLIGGPGPGQGNVISGHSAGAVFLTGDYTTAGYYRRGSNNIVQGNKIGTDVAGARAIPNAPCNCSGGGLNTIVEIRGSDNDTIDGNIISGNNAPPIAVDSDVRTPITIRNNYIGTNPGGQSVPNSQGVYFASPGLFSGNVVANNQDVGLNLASGAHVQITRNSFYNNTSYGIVSSDYRRCGPLDPTLGNDNQPCATITDASVARIAGKAQPGYTVEVFSSTHEADDGGMGEGKTYLGSAVAGTDGSWTLPAPYAASLHPGDWVTTTATTATSPVETSTFGPDFQVSATCSPSDTKSIVVTGIPIAATEGAPFNSLKVASFTSPCGADPAQYTALVGWGDSDAPLSRGAIAANPGGGFDVTGSYTYAEEGSFPVHVSITFTGGAGGAGGSAATVANAPLSATGHGMNGGVNRSQTYVVASFTDADPAGTVSDYTATIAWGDGQTSSGVISPNGSGGFDVTGTHTYTTTGPFTTTVTITDAGSNVTTTSSAKVESPTAARVARFSVTRQGSRTLFKWRMAVQEGVAAFNLYAGSRRLNRQPIAAHRQRTYTYRAGHAGSGPFTLEVILIDGQRLRVPS